MLLLNARLQLEEERDTLQVRCTRNRTTIAELRACLQHERDGKTQSSWLLGTIHLCDVHVVCVVHQERVRSIQDVNHGLLYTSLYH